MGRGTVIFLCLLVGTRIHAASVRKKLRAAAMSLRACTPAPAPETSSQILAPTPYPPISTTGNILNDDYSRTIRRISNNKLLENAWHGRPALSTPTKNVPRPQDGSKICFPRKTEDYQLLPQSTKCQNHRTDHVIFVRFKRWINVD
jgi:hypothetical protein